MDKLPKYIVDSKSNCQSLGLNPIVVPVLTPALSSDSLNQRKTVYEDILSVVDCSMNRLIKLMRGIPLLVLVTDQMGCILEVGGDDSMKKMAHQAGIIVGIEFLEEITGTNSINLALKHGEPIQLIGREHYHQYMEAFASYSVPFRLKDCNSIIGTVTIMTSVVHHNPFLLPMLSTVADNIERELLLRERNSKLIILNEIMNNSNRNGIVVTNQEGIITEFNQFAERILGLQKEFMIGNHVRYLEPLGQFLMNLLDTGETYEDVELIIEQTDSSKKVLLMDALPIFDKNQDFLGTFAQFRDITEQHDAREKVNYLAHHDDLTSLPNRRYFLNHLKMTLERAKKDKELFALLFLDLDRFKVINDTLGHSSGDTLLQLVAQRLQNCHDKSHVYRMAGDEFTLLLHQITNVNNAIDVAELIIKQFKDPFIINDHDFYITTSIGIAVYPHDGSNAETLMKNVDYAMYRAKDRGKNNFFVYQKPDDEKDIDHLIIESSLKTVLQNNGLILYYQPKISIETGLMVGVEALIRWQHPTLGFLSPEKFIPLAEETGLISQIGEWVLKEACEQHKKWIKEGLPPIKIAVNLSIRQFLTQNLVQTIQKVLENTGVHPEFLMLEITESMTMDVDYAIETLQGLKEIGIAISMDDFGTGYSSLYYLKKFAIDYLKIDQSFVRDMMTDSNDADIVSTIIAMAHSLGLRVIAEGVETKEQLEFLQIHSCDEVQGYYFKAPVPEDQITDYYKGCQLNVE